MTSKTTFFSTKAALVTIIAVWIAIYLLGLDQTAIFDPNESYYAEAAREMVESGNWITPHLNYQIYFSKPILTFWLIAGAYKIFGVSEFSARIAFSLLALLLLLGVFFIARQIAGTRCGILSAIISATAPLMMVTSRISPIDIELTCFLNLAIFAWIANHIFGLRKFWPCIYIFLALAVLAKGPIVLLLFLLCLGPVLLIEFISNRQYGIQPRRRFSSARTVSNDLSGSPAKHSLQQLFPAHLIAGCLIFLAITLPWFIAVQIETKGLFLKVFWFYENLARFSGHTNFAHGHWYHYILVLFYSFFPWVIFLIPAIKLVSRGNDSSKSDSDDRPIRALIYLLCYVMVIFFVISFSGTQMDTYLLPVIAPLAIVIGYYLEKEIENSTHHLTALRVNSAILAILGVGALVFFALVVLLPVITAIKIIVVLIATIHAVGFVVQYWLGKQGKTRQMVAVLCTTTTIVCILVFHFAFKFIDQSGPHDLKTLSLKYRNSRDNLAMFHAFKPSILFYTAKPIDSFLFIEQLILNTQTAEINDIERMPNKERLLVFVHDQYLSLLKATPGLKLIPLDKQGPWQVMLVANATLKKGLTLEQIFKQAFALGYNLKQDNAWGPLTVPYTAGR